MNLRRLFDLRAPLATVPYVAGCAATGAGGTRLVERAEHHLRLEPVVYWAPVARWVIDTNNARVLAHIKRVAEAGVAAAPPTPRSCRSAPLCLDRPVNHS